MLRNFRPLLLTLAILSSLAQTQFVRGSDLYLSLVDGPSPNHKSLQRFDESGNALATIAYNDIAAYIAVDATGNLYVANISGSVTKFDALGLSQGVFAILTSNPDLRTPGAIAIDSTGRLLAGLRNPAAGSSIESFSSDGMYLGTFAVMPSSSIISLFDLFVDKRDHAYIPIQQGRNGAVLHFSSTGDLLATMPIAGVQFIDSLAVDSAGNLFVVVNRNRIEKFNDSGTSLGTTVSNLGFIHSIAIDESDVLYVGGGSELETKGFVKKFSTSGVPLGNYLTGLPGIPLDMAFL